MPSVLKQTFFYSISTFLMKGISLLMLPVVAHYLSPEEFGQLEILASIAVIGSILVGLGLEDALFRFAGSECNPQKKSALASHLYFISLMLSSLALMLFWVLSQLWSYLLPGELSQYHINLVLVLLSLESLIAIPLGWSRMRDKVWVFCGASVGRVVIHAAFTFLLLSFGRGISGILEASLIAAAVQVVYLSFWLIRDVGVHWLAEINRRLWPYCWPIVASGLLMFVFNGLDRWILAHYSSIAAVGIYGIAAKFALGVAILMQPFGIWWSPKRFEILSQYNGLNKVAKYSQAGIILCGFICISIIYFGPWLIQLLLPLDYHQAGEYLIFVACAFAFKEVTEVVNIGCFHKDSTKIQFYINASSAVFAAVLMFCLTVLFDLQGLVFAVAVAYMARMLLFYFASQSQLKIPYQNSVMVLLSLVCVSSLVFYLLLLKNESAVLQLLGYLLTVGMLAYCFVRLLNIPMVLPKFIGFNGPKRIGL